MKKYIIFIWVIFASSALYLYFFHPVFFQNQLGSAFSLSAYFGYVFFLILGFLRGFTLIPVLILTGTVVGTAAIYVVKKNPNALFPTTQIQGNAREKTSGGGEKSMAERFLDLVDQKIKSIITPSAPIGNFLCRLP